MCYTRKEDSAYEDRDMVIATFLPMYTYQPIQTTEGINYKSTYVQYLEIKDGN
jgi:hypothetical protein